MIGFYIRTGDISVTN